MRAMAAGSVRAYGSMFTWSWQVLIDLLPVLQALSRRAVAQGLAVVRDEPAGLHWPRAQRVSKLWRLRLQSSRNIAQCCRLQATTGAHLVGIALGHHIRAVRLPGGGEGGHGQALQRGSDQRRLVCHAIA
jgi:hypothetical protein